MREYRIDVSQLTPENKKDNAIVYAAGSVSLQR